MPYSEKGKYKTPSIVTPSLSVSKTKQIEILLDSGATEGTLTNRAAAYIKLKKYKEALQDSEHALLLNPNFAKAHVRAYLCYTQVGNFEKAD